MKQFKSQCHTSWQVDTKDMRTDPISDNHHYRQLDTYNFLQVDYMSQDHVDWVQKKKKEQKTKTFKME